MYRIMLKENAICALTIQAMPGIFNRRIKKFREKYNHLSATELLDLIHKKLKQTNGENAAEPFNLDKKMLWAGEQIDKVAEQGIQWTTIFDLDYPPLLYNIVDPPAILFYRGRLPNVQWLTIAIVGTRNASNLGLKYVKDFFYKLNSSHIQIVSGLARGIDAACHREANRYRLPNYAVLGSGLNRIYPKVNLRLTKEILDNDGAILSEFLPDTGPDKFRFPQRNRIISGLSHKTLLIEAGQKSGALGTCQWALDQNREVWVMPPPFANSAFSGNAGWVNAGAFLLHDSSELLAENYSQSSVNEKESKREGIVEKKEFGSSSGLAALDHDQKAVYHYILAHRDGVHREALIENSLLSSGSPGKMEVVLHSLKDLHLIYEDMYNLLFPLA